MENNKLIVEFMGNPTIFNPIHDATLYQVKEQDNMTYHIDELQYHLSWDWLMPVISKCLEIGKNVPVERIYHSLHTQDLSFAYKSVVEFINQNN